MRVFLRTLAAGLVGSAAVVAPAVAEWSGLQALRAGLGQCPGSPPRSSCGGASQIDVDRTGLRLWHPWRMHAGFRVDADAIAIAAGLTGIEVTVDNPQWIRRPFPIDDPPRSAEPPTVARTSLNTHGVPIQIRVRGTAQWSRDGWEVSALDPQLYLDGAGHASASLGVQLRGHGVEFISDERWVAHSIGRNLRHWQAKGAWHLRGATSVPTELRVTSDGLDVQLRDREGGRLSIHTAWPTVSEPLALVDVRAEQFELASLGRSGLGLLNASGWAGDGIDLSRARLDAVIRSSTLASGRRDPQTIELNSVRIDGLVIDHPKIARTPTRFDSLGIAGLLQWNSPHEQSAQLRLSHRQARVALDVHRDEQAIDLHAALDPISCQGLVDAFPSAMSEMIEGTELSGDLDASFDVHIDRSQLAMARAQRDRPVDSPPPGTLRIEFPFLERCTVIRDAPRLDFGALTGPYRHRWIDDRGDEHHRIMAPGATGYVSLREVPLIAHAFTVLEDRRFWDHDGFDREQIHHAFWHNWIKGRVSRGASTISQQTARNLWLGIDRSWGRKLQEALLTARLEASIDKDRIIELYLNIVELGPGIHGVAQAARHYFGRSATQLNAIQAVHLAALAPAPRRYAARFADGQVDTLWLDTLHEHLRRMARAGLLDAPSLAGASASDLALVDRR